MFTLRNDCHMFFCCFLGSSLVSCVGLFFPLMVKHLVLIPDVFSVIPELLQGNSSGPALTF